MDSRDYKNHVNGSKHLKKLNLQKKDTENKKLSSANFILNNQTNEKPLSSKRFDKNTANNSTNMNKKNYNNKSKGRTHTRWDNQQNQNWQSRGQGYEETYRPEQDYNPGYGYGGYDQSWAYNVNTIPLYHLYQEPVQSQWQNEWQNTNNDFGGKTRNCFPPGQKITQPAASSASSQKLSPSAASGKKLSNSPTKPPLPKRPNQSIKEAKRDAKERREKAAQLVKEMTDQKNIDIQASKLKATLASMQKQGSLVKTTFGRTLSVSQDEEDDRPKAVLNDLSLTADDLAEIGSGKNVAESAGECSPEPPVLPVYANSLPAAPLPAPAGEVQGRARVAYDLASARTKLAGRRKRTVSDSETNRGGLSLKRTRKVSELDASTSVELTKADNYDQAAVNKFKAALLKMNKWELRELVNSPTSSKSKMLMTALVRDHRRHISQRLNNVRFNCTSKLLVGISANLDITDSLVEVDMESLPPELILHISDIIKMEVPDVEILAERLSKGESLGDKIKEEPQQDPNKIKHEEATAAADADLNNMMNANENVFESISSEDEIMEVPVPPKPAPPIVAIDADDEDSPDKDAPSYKFGEKNRQVAKSVSRNKQVAVPLEGLRREPKKRGRPKKGEIRKNLGEEIVIGTISDQSGSEVASSSSQGTSQIKKQKQPGNLRGESTSEVVSEPQAGEGENGERENGERNTKQNLGLIFEQETRLLGQLEEVESKMRELGSTKANLLQQLQFLNELKRQIVKS